jgi:hypothetical protein
MFCIPVLCPKRNNPVTRYSVMRLRMSAEIRLRQRYALMSRSLGWIVHIDRGDGLFIAFPQIAPIARSVSILLYPQSQGWYLHILILRKALLHVAATSRSLIPLIDSMSNRPPDEQRCAGTDNAQHNDRGIWHFTHAGRAAGRLGAGHYRCRCLVAARVGSCDENLMAE